MEEIVTEVPRKRPSRKGPVILLFILIIAALVGGYIIFGAGAKTPDPAKYVPQDASIAVTVDLTSSADKDAAVSFVKGLFKDAGVDKPVDEMFAEINKNLKIDVEKDVLPHLNGVGAIAVLTEMAGVAPEAAAAIGTKGKSDASALMKLITNQLTTNKVKFDKGSYAKHDYLRITISGGFSGGAFAGPQMIHYIGAVKDVLVYADSEGAFKKVADTIDGKPSLLDSSEYKKLRKTGPTTFATAYYSGPSFCKLIGPMLSMSAGTMAPGSVESLKESIQANVAAVGTAEATADGLRFTTKGITASKVKVVETVKVDELAKFAPADAAVVFAGQGWDIAWAEIKKQLDRDPNTKAQVAQSVAAMKQAMGVDVFADFLDRITAINGYYVPGAQAKPTDFPGALTLVLSLDKPDVVTGALPKLHKMIAMSGGPAPKEAMIAGRKATSVPLGSQGGELCDAVVGDKLVITVSAGGTVAMQAAIDAAESKGENVTSTDWYAAVRKQLPGDAQAVFCGDVGTVMKAFSKEMPEKDRKAAEKILGKVGSFGISGQSSATEYESQAVLPFGK